jgi:hypothetical protein
MATLVVRNVLRRGMIAGYESGCWIGKVSLDRNAVWNMPTQYAAKYSNR